VPRQVNDAYRDNKYREVIDEGNELLKKEPTNAELVHLMGRSYAMLGKYDSSLRFLDRAISLDNHHMGWITGWSYEYLGYDYYCKGELEKAEQNLQICIDMHKTNNSVRTAQHMMQIITLSRYFEKRPKIETENIIYHFEDTVGINAQEYVKTREAAYQYINNKLPTTLPRKIDFYVWTDTNESYRLFSLPTRFSLPFVFVCNSSVKSNPGSEIALMLSYWCYGQPPEKQTRFIDEGIAACFDGNNTKEKDSLFHEACGTLKNSNFHTVLDMWQYLGKYPSELYPVAGGFVQFMLDHSSQQQFEELIKNQTIDNAKSVYGAKFDPLIGEFNKMIL